MRGKCEKAETTALGCVCATISRTAFHLFPTVSCHCCHCVDTLSTLPASLLEHSVCSVFRSFSFLLFNFPSLNFTCSLRLPFLTLLCVVSAVCSVVRNGKDQSGT